MQPLVRKDRTTGSRPDKSKVSGPLIVLSQNIATMPMKPGSNQLCKKIRNKAFLIVKIFLTLRRTRSFFLDDKTSAHDISSSCLFIPRKGPRTHFETSSVMVSYYDYEI